MNTLNPNISFNSVFEKIIDIPTFYSHQLPQLLSVILNNITTLKPCKFIHIKNLVC